MISLYTVSVENWKLAKLAQSGHPPTMCLTVAFLSKLFRLPLQINYMFQEPGQ